MTSRFNPNEPLTVGMEWWPEERQGEPIDFGREIGLRVIPTSTVTVTGMALNLAGPSPLSGHCSWVLATIYPEGDEADTGQVRQLNCLPNIGATSGGALGGGATSVLEAVTTPNDGLYLTLDSSDTMTLNFAIPSPPFLTSRPRILDVTFEMIFTPVATGTFVDLNWQPTVNDIGLIKVDRTGLYRARLGEINLAAIDYTPTANPNRRPWIKNDIDLIQLGTVDLQVAMAGGSVRVDYVGMVVTYCEENRLGFGAAVVASNPSYAPQASGTWPGPLGGSVVPLYKATDGTLGVVLTAGVAYLALVTRAVDVDIDGLQRGAKLTGHPVNFQYGPARTLTSLRPANTQVIQCREARRLSDGRLFSTVDKMDAACSMALTASGGLGTPGIIEPLSQCYANVFSQPYTLPTQRLAAAQTTVVREVTVRVRRFGTPTPADIVITSSGLNSPSATILGTDYDAAEKDSLGYATLRGRFTNPVVLAANTTQEFGFNPGTVSGPNRWEILEFNSQGSSTDYDLGTYGGITYFGNGDQSSEVALTLHTDVPAVTGLSVGRGFQPLVGLADDDCGDASDHILRSVDYANVCWGLVPVAFGEPYIDLPGTTGNYLSLTTGSPTVTGDLCIIARVWNDNWANAANSMIVSRWGPAAGNLTYRWYVIAPNLRFEWTVDGTTTIGVSSDPHGLANSTWYWLAVTLDVDNGAGGRNVNFWSSADGLTWSGLGSTKTTTSGSAALFGGGTSQIFMGANNSGTGNLLDGRLAWVSIRKDGGANPTAGTEVFRYNALTNLPADPNANSFTASTGQTITVSRSGSPSTRLAPIGTEAMTPPMVSGFCAWQIERRDDIDTEWRRIADISGYAITCCPDFECRIGVPTDYRVRMARFDDEVGDWAEFDDFIRYGASTATTSPVVTGGCEGLIFTSNEAFDSTLAYPYAYEGSGTPREQFTFNEPANVTLQRLHMRDYQIALRPLERGGVRFQRTMLVNHLSLPAARLDEGFRSLRDLAWETLSYVCVLDHRGGRWLATVLVPDGTVREINQVYLASVDIIETTNVPSVIDVVAVP